MPHVVVKMYSGRSNADKTHLAAAITQAVTETLGASENSVSVSIEDVEPRAWADKVFIPDIAGKADTLFKRPGYGLADL